MTTMTAAQHAHLWRRRPSDHAVSMPLSMSTGLLSPYASSASASPASSAVADSPASAAFAASSASAAMDMAMPTAFPPQHPQLLTSLPPPALPQPTGYSLLPYHVPQPYAVSYPPPVSHAAAYAGGSHPHAFAHPHVVPPPPPSHHFPAQPVYASAPPPPRQNAGVDFSTDVDTLMKAIQAKPFDPADTTTTTMETAMPTSPAAAASSKVQALRSRRVCAAHAAPQAKPRQKPRRRYECTLPDCSKMFYQKTHLEIHIRAHTGAKPYVRWASLHTASRR